MERVKDLDTGAFRAYDLQVWMPLPAPAMGVLSGGLTPTAPAGSLAGLASSCLARVVTVFRRVVFCDLE